MTQQKSASLDRFLILFSITFLGSALSSISSFLMVETVSTSLGWIGFALAAKTAVSALFSTVAARIVDRLGFKQSLIFSQVLGIILLLPLFYGIHFQQPLIFMAGITIGSLPMLIFNTVVMANFRLFSKDDNDFRHYQSRLQLATSVILAISALAAPVLLQNLTYISVLLLDAVTCAVCLVVFILWAGESVGSTSPTQAATAEGVTTSKFSMLSNASLLLALSIFATYILKAVSPMLAASNALRDIMSIEISLRQSLWAVEAVAGILAGMTYKRLHVALARFRVFEVGIVNGVCFALLLAVLSYVSLLVALFLMCYLMTMTYMKVRDDYLMQAKDREDTLKAIGWVNVVTNATLTVSPIALGAAFTQFGLAASLALFAGFQIVAWILIHVFVRNPRAKSQT